MVKPWELLRPSSLVINSPLTQDDINESLASVFAANPKGEISLINPFRKYSPILGVLTPTGFRLKTTTSPYASQSMADITGEYIPHTNGTQVNITVKPNTLIALLVPFWLFVNIVTLISIFTVPSGGARYMMIMITVFLFLFGVLRPLVFFHSDRNHTLHELEKILIPKQETH